MARQLTIVEANLFKKVTPYEFMSQSWSGADKQLLTPNIIAISTHFNLVYNSPPSPLSFPFLSTLIPYPSNR